MHILIFGKKNKNLCDFDLIKFLQISIFGTKPLLTILQKSSSGRYKWKKSFPLVSSVYTFLLC